jgi:hypothetical protein
MKNGHFVSVRVRARQVNERDFFAVEVHRQRVFESYDRPTDRRHGRNLVDVHRIFVLEALASQAVRNQNRRRPKCFVRKRVVPVGIN